MAFEHLLRAIRELWRRAPSSRRISVKHRQRRLRIDPLEDRHLLAIDSSWAIPLGGFGALERGIATTSNGDVVVTGSFSGTVDFDPGPSQTNLTALGVSDIFIAKYSAAGSLQWANRIGETPVYTDAGTAVTVDTNGNILVTGQFTGNVDFDPGAGVTQLSSSGGTWDVFVLKLNSNGNFVWARSVGAGSDDVGAGIATDSSGNVYATGRFVNTVDFDPGPGTFNLNSGGAYGSFVLKLDATGTFSWAAGLTGNSTGHAVAVDAAQNVYVTGEMPGSSDFDPGAGTLTLSSAGDHDIYVWKLTQPGGLGWARLIGSSGRDHGNGIAVDANGAVIVAGRFEQTVDFDPGAGVANLSSAGNADGFIVNLNSFGNYVWAQRIGGTASDIVYGLALDAAGRPSIAGAFSGTVDFDLGAGVVNHVSAGGTDSFIIGLATDGSFVEGAQSGGGSDDSARAIAVDQAGYAVVAGTFSGTVDFNPGTSIESLTSSTATDSYAWRLGLGLSVPTANLSVSSTSLLENAGSASVIATLSSTSSQTVTVNLAFSGTATLNSDYSRSGASITIPAGSTTGSITITSVNDFAFEGDESVVIDVSTVTNGIENGSQQTTIVVVDDDLPSPASLTISNNAMLEGNSGSSPLSFPVVRSGDLTQSLRATFVTTPGSATAEVDYQSTSSTITFPAGITSGSTFAVPVIGDATPEANETLQAVLTQLDGVSGAVAFSAPQTMAAVDSVGLFIVDLNLDGRNDVVVTRLVSNSIAVFMNTTVIGASSATFAAPQTFATPSQPCCVVAGDLNGDGRSDLIISSQAAANMSVFLNTTTAGAAAVSLASRVDFSTGSGPRGLAIADLNGDGRPDVLTANRYSNTLSILLNTTAAGATTPSFSSKQDFATGDNPQSVAAQDINGDGRPDIAVANFYSSSVSVFLNSTAAGASSASLSARTDFASVANSRTVAGGDLNGDGRPDLATANYNNGTISVLLNTTAPGASLPSFTAHQEFSVDTKPHDIQIRDLNKDGKFDVIVATRFQSSISVLINNTLPDADSATFAAFQRIATASDPLFLAVGDLNRDGLLDLATTSDTSDVLAVVTNSTTVAAVEPGWSTSSVNVGSGPKKVSSGDLNNDGRPDLIVSQSGATNLGVLLSTSLAAATVPTFSNQQDVQLVVAPNGSTTADVNNDGKLDLIVGLSDTNSSIAVFLNTTLPGAASFSYLPAQTFSLGAGWRAWDVSMRDLNGDGRADFVVSATGFNRIVVIPNTTTLGSSTVGFGTLTAIDSGNCHNLAFADLNGDGLIDIISTESPGSTITLLRNTTSPGASTFSFVRQSISTLEHPHSVAIGDLNRDGLPDLVLADYTGNTVSVFFNTTSVGASGFAFATRQTSAVGSNPETVVVGDFNLDGNLDIGVSHASDSFVSILLNSTSLGSSVFAISERVDAPVGAETWGLAAADLNTDGRLDLITSHYLGSTLSIVANLPADLPYVSAVGTILNDDNHAPVNTVPTGLSTNEDTSLSVSGISITDVDSVSIAVTVTLSVSQGVLTVATNISGGVTSGDLASNGTSSVSITAPIASINAVLGSVAGLVYTPLANFNGVSLLTLLTNDLGSTGGALTDVDTVVITVNAVNDGPTNTVPGAQTVNEDTALVISGISIADVDAGTANVKVTFTVASGTLTVSSTAVNGVTSGAISSNGSSTVTITASQSAINATLADASGLVYEGSLNFSGSDMLTVTTNDQGNNDVGGPLTDVDTVAITVNAVNDGLHLSIVTPISMTRNDPLGQYPPSSTLLANVSGVLFFSERTSPYGSELWKSDGTINGKALVRDISPADSDAFPQCLTNVNGTLYFSANDGPHGRELWKSDGTNAGTVLVNDSQPGAGSAYPRYLTNVCGTLYFIATDGSTGYELWKSDGTSAGTVIVKDINPGASGASLRDLTNVNGTLYFRANDGSTGYELWKSDGTSTGTVLVKDINPGVTSANPRYLTNVNGTLYFSANDGTSGTELWESDGTSAGTKIVKDIRPGAMSGSSQALTNANGALYFSANDGTNGYELWKSDGTSTGTLLVRDINPGPSSGGLASLTNVNGTLYFAANDGTNGQQIWKSDGNSAGTVLVTDISQGIYGSDLRYLSNVNGTLYFTAKYGANGDQLWMTDGTSAGTHDLVNQITGQWFYVLGVTGELNDQFYFIAMILNESGPIANELWSYSPSPMVDVDEDSTVTLGGINLSDVDAGSADVSVSLSVSHGTLVVSSTVGNGITSGQITGNGSGAISIVAPMKSINATLSFMTGLTYVPSPNFSGSDQLQIVANDLGNVGLGGALIDSDTIAITISAQNDAPVNTVPGAQSVNEDTTLVISGISISDVDASTANISVTLSVVSGTLSVSTNASGGGVTSGAISGNGSGTVTITGSLVAINATLANASGLVYQGTLNFNGSDALTVTTNDLGNAGTGGALTDTDTIAITVNEVNDTPVNSVPGTLAVDEDTALVISGISISDVDGGTANVSLTLSVVTGTLTVITGNPPYAFNDIIIGGVSLGQVMGNGSGQVTITAPLAAINATLVNDGVIYLSNLDLNGVEFGGTVLTIETDDLGSIGLGGPLVDTDTTWIAINPVNDAPVNTLPDVLATDEDASFGIRFLSISDVDTGSANVLVTLNVANGTLTVSTNAVSGVTSGVISGNGSSTVTIIGSPAAINGTLYSADLGVTYLADVDFSGIDVLTITTNDLGNSGTGGVLTDTDTIAITVNAVNDGPTNTVPGAQTVSEDTALVISGLSVADVDAGTANVSVTLSVASGTLTVSTNAVNGVTSGVISGNGSNTVTLTGSQAKINATLASVTGVTYQGTLNFNGSDVLTVLTNDLGNTGTGGALTDSDTVAITITEVNDAPTGTNDALSAIAEDSGNYTISFASLLGNDSTGPDNESGQALTITAVGSPIGGTVAIVGSDVVFSPTLNYNGPASFSYTLRDNGTTNGVDAFLPNTATVSFTITEVNDAPSGINDSLSPIAEVSGDQTISFASLLANDSTGPDNESGQALAITAVGSPIGGTVAIVGSDVVFSPTLNYNGPASFSYTLRDNGTTNLIADPKSATATAIFTISEVNDAPSGVTDNLGTLTGATTIPFATLLGNDSKGPANESSQTLTITAVGSAVGGAVGISGSNVVFTPTSGYSGPGSFVYTLQDNGTTNGLLDAKTATATASFAISAAGITLNPGIAKPVVDLNGPAANFGNSVTFTEGSAGVLLTTSDSTVIDSDSSALANVKVSLLATPDGTYESLVATVIGTEITAAYNSTTRVLTLTGPDTIGNFQQVLRTVRYLNTSNSPITTARTARIVANDGANSSLSRDVTINIVAINNPPSISMTATPLPFVENGVPVVIDSAVAPIELDSVAYVGGSYQISLQGATISVSPWFAGEDKLIYTSTAGIGATINQTTGVLRMTAITTLANYQTALRAIQYQNTSDNPNAGSRVVTFTVTDGASTSSATRTINVTAVNDAPTADLNGPVGSGNNYSTTYRTSTGTIPITYSTSTLTDLDNVTMTSLSVTITNVQNVSNEVLTYTLPGGISASASSNTASTVVFTGVASPSTYQTLLRSIQYRNLAGSPTLGTPRIITVVTNDGTSTLTSTTTVTLVSPLHAASDPAKVVADRITATELKPIVQAAIGRWSALGLTPAQVAQLQSTTYVVSNIGFARELGQASSGKVVTIDDNAAGFGWFVDTTPLDDSEFSKVISRSERIAPRMNRMDLLTVVMHEMGHILGLPDIDDDKSTGVMTDAIAAGTRRVSTVSDLRALAFYLSQNTAPSTAPLRNTEAARADVFARWS